MKAALINKPEEIAHNHYLLRVRTPGSESIPGQFINIKIGNGTDPLIRRPFSIFNHEEDIISIIVRVVGKGTELLSNTDKGDIDLLGPLGKGFSIVERKKVLLVGGGVGNAPLFYLGKILKELKNDISYIYGSQSRRFVFLKNKFKALSGNFIITTNDGTEGKKGLATDAVKDFILSNNFDMVYTCGPAIMMRRIIKLLKDETPVEVSIEKYFGCGIGLCSGCSIETGGELKRACIDGPVFDGRTINWDC